MGNSRSVSAALTCRSVGGEASEAAPIPWVHAVLTAELPMAKPFSVACIQVLVLMYASLPLSVLVSLLNDAAQGQNTRNHTASCSLWGTVSSAHAAASAREVLWLLIPCPSWVPIPPPLLLYLFFHFF